MLNDYWDRTDRFLARNGGPPTCPSCGQEMFAADDHGRFACFCNGNTLDAFTGSVSVPMEIPQIDVTGMTDAEKAQIPAINRLNAPGTAAEQAFFAVARGGPDAMDTPEYWAAAAALDREREGDRNAPPS